VTSASPAEGAKDVRTSDRVSVTFSEPMDKPSAEAAFSLVRSSDGSSVAGSFSWSGDTMTFTPAAPLASGTGYTVTVKGGASSAPARDVAGNPLAADLRRTFTTLASVSAAANATVIQSGSLRSGSYARLGADDNAYYQVNSTTSGTRTSAWYARFANVSNSLQNLRVSYSGKASASCTQTVAIWSWTTSSWVQLDSRLIGITELRIDKAPGGAPADYVSGTSGDGELRVRIRCTRSSPSFYSSADLLRVAYDRPVS
jgi:hypothetical protein